MAQMDDTGNVQPIRTVDDEAALAWLRRQAGGRPKLSDAELGRRWGWKRQRVGRRVKAWAKDGRITRRGNTITYTDVHLTEGAGPGTQVELVPPSVPSPAPLLVPPAVPSLVPPQDMQFVPSPVPPQDMPISSPDKRGDVDVQPPPGRSVAIRNAARDAATGAAPDNGYVARLVTLDGAYVHLPPADTRPTVPSRQGVAVDLIAYTAAVALAGAAAWFSIRGMTVLFPGSPMSVIVMAVSMEAAKLVTAGWLARRCG